MNMTTVIHSFPTWLPQTQTWMYNQIRCLPKDIEPHIVCDNTKNLEQFALANIHTLTEEKSYWYYYWGRGLRFLHLRHHSPYLVEKIQKYKGHILHSHFGPVGWFNIGAAKQSQLSHLVTFYGYDVNYLPRKDVRWRKRYQDMFGVIDSVLCEGPHMAKCIQALGCPEEKIIVQRLGIMNDEIAFQPRSWSPTEPLRVLIAASFREKKGIPYALEALGHLKKELPIEITIIGDAGTDSREQLEKAKILNIIDALGIKPTTRLLGYQPYHVIFEEAYKHHIFLSPSVTAEDGDTEGGAPVTIIEMAATGMPIVSTTHCDIPQVIQHGVTGWLAKERDVNGLVLLLRQLIEMPEKWYEMLVAARKHVENQFDAKAQGEKLGEIYRNLGLN